LPEDKRGYYKKPTAAGEDGEAPVADKDEKKTKKSAPKKTAAKKTATKKTTAKKTTTTRKKKEASE
ncbi:MAG: hypothetical protein II290_00190, partial [Oscillospiraceae bacterium]|nr:hypothetical protein [Oscillospiraceae bacterium]